MESVLVITGGDGPDTLPPYEYDGIIASDSGYDRARLLGLRPTVILGDMDSTRFRDEVMNLGAAVFPRDKDESDTELAIRMTGGRTYDLMGGGGGRTDHLLAVFALFDRYPLPRYWFTGSDVLVSCNGQMTMRLEKGTDVSIIPATGKTSMVSSSGLRWELKDFAVNHSSLSLSNRSEKTEITVKSEGDVFIRIPARYLPIIDDCVLSYIKR
ncbi:MAG: thiamine diphosphokinase [Bullifex sp.]